MDVGVVLAFYLTISLVYFRHAIGYSIVNYQVDNQWSIRWDTPVDSQFCRSFIGINITINPLTAVIAGF